MVARSWFPFLIGLAVATAAGREPKVQVLSSDRTGFGCRVEFGEPVLVGTSQGTRVELAGCDNVAEPGCFDLPSKTIRVGLPQGGGYQLEVVARDTYSLSAVVARVPRCSWEDEWDEQGHGASEGELVAKESSAAATEKCGQLGWVVAGAVSCLRGVRFVPLTLKPVQYDARQRTVRVARTLELRVRFEQPPVELSITDPLAEVVRNMLLNGTVAAAWTVAEMGTNPNPFARSANWLRIRIDSTGLYGITGRELAAAGLALPGLVVSTLALYRPQGADHGASFDSLVPVPIHVDDGGDGRFDADDVIVFWGIGASHWTPLQVEYVTNLYSNQSAYWLTWGGEVGARMSAGLGPDSIGARRVTTGLGRARIEKDFICPARSGLLWLWQQLYKPREQLEALFQTDIRLAAPSRLLGIAGRLLADSSGNTVNVRLNGRQVGTLVFNEATPGRPFLFSLATDLPLDFTSNSIELSLRGNGGRRLWVDYFEVEYEKQLTLECGQLVFVTADTGLCRYVLRGVRALPYVVNTTVPERPFLIAEPLWQADSFTFCHRAGQPNEFAVATRSQLRRPREIRRCQPGRLRDRLVSADYWIVAPSSQFAAAERLARYRTGNVPGISNARVATAVLEDIYDDYGGGNESPWAVKHFIAEKQPSYVLLVGDATCDYRGLLGSRPAGVPAWEYGYGLNPDAYDRTVMAFDAWYADFEGDGGSPDAILGRVTTRDGAELSQYVSRIIEYDSRPTGYWQRRFLLLADDEFEGSANRPDPIGFGHIAYCEAMAALADNTLEPVKVYLTEYPYVGVKNKPGAHAALMQELGRGGLVLVFFGHGAGHDLTHESVLNITHISSIRNEGRSPVCFFGSCSVGRFDDWLFECIAEDIVRQGGAIAAVAATKATTSGSNQVFCRQFLTPLFSWPDSAVGLSFFLAWPTDRIYHFFGDPALRLRLPAVATAPVTVRPSVAQPLLQLACRAVLDTLAGEYEWRFFGPHRSRLYRSTQGQVIYTLAGIEAGRGRGTIEHGMVSFQTMLPLGIPLDTLFVGDGYYAPVLRSCRVGVVARDRIWRNDTIGFALDPVPSDDTTGPTVELRCSGTRLTDGATVPRDFTLEVILTDTSGVLGAAIPFGAVTLTIGTAAPIDVTARLVFGDSYRHATLTVPVSLAQDSTRITVVASDNALNRTTTTAMVRSSSVAELKLDSLLLFPNPARHSTGLFFWSSLPAVARFRIHTISGRLVFDSGARAVRAGQNQLDWHGRDQQGNIVPCGVYLVSLRLTSATPDRQSHTTTACERLIIRR